MGTNVNADYDPTYIKQRTSLMAILALVLGLVCVPGLGVLGVIFGIGAIIAISNSRGRLIGTGMAVTGVVLGLLFSVIWIGIGIGVNQARNALDTKVIQPTNQVMASFDSSGDPQIIRNLFSPSVSATITDAQIVAFRDAYRAEVGAFKTIPTGIAQFFQGYAKFGQQMQKYQATPGQPPGMIPVPAEFEKGWVMVVLQMDQSRTGGANVQVPGGGNITVKGQPPAGQPVLPIIDVIIETLGGKMIRLSEMPGGPTAADPAKVVPAPDAKGAETKPDADKPSEAKPPEAPKEPAKTDPK